MWNRSCILHHYYSFIHLISIFIHFIMNICVYFSVIFIFIIDFYVIENKTIIVLKKVILQLIFHGIKQQLLLQLVETLLTDKITI